MDESTVKEMRQSLRQVQEHLAQAHLSLGAQRTTVGLVDVVHHPTNKLPELNYVTPRKSTAWVSAKEVEQGIEQLRKLGRTPRVYYVEGLFPPLFAKTLTTLGLKVEQETPIMLFRPENAPIKSPDKPDGVTVLPVSDHRGVETWWYVWRNAFYDVISMGVEPVFVGRDMREIALGRQVDIVAYHYGFPVGVARVTVYGETSHIAALALMKEHRTPEMLALLQAAAIKEAVARKCALVFAPGQTEQDRRLCRDMGFVDSGSIVCYAEKTEQAYGEANGLLAEPVLVLR